MQLEQVRDFVMLHYKATERTDTPFWVETAAMSIPDSLAAKIELFRENGRVFRWKTSCSAKPAGLPSCSGRASIREGSIRWPMCFQVKRFPDPGPDAEVHHQRCPIYAYTCGLYCAALRKQHRCVRRFIVITVEERL